MVVADQVLEQGRRVGIAGRSIRRSVGRLAPLLIGFAVLGCSTITLISRYDEVTDQSVTAFGKKMDSFLASLERNTGKQEASYDANVSFYDGARVDIRAMQVRAKAIPKNEITQEQLALLMSSVEDLEKLHRIKANGQIPSDEIAHLRTAFQTSCGAVLKLELAKKRGEGK